MSAPSAHAVLQELVVGPADAHHDLRLILVPDCGVNFSDQLASSQWSWLTEMFRQISCHAQCFEFQYRWHPASSGKSAWADCFDRANVLFDSLIDLETTQIKPVPFVLIASGIGGMVLKRTVTKLKDGCHQPNVRSVWKKIAQIVLIGCPHPVEPREWPQLGPILRHDRGLTAKDVAYRLAAQHESIAAGICRGFQEAGTSCPILTTYERSPPKPKMREVINPLELARTAVKQERLIELNLEGRELRRLSENNDSYVGFKYALKEQFQKCYTNNLDDDDDSCSESSSMTNSLYQNRHLFQTTPSVKSITDLTSQFGMTQIFESPQEATTSPPPWSRPQYQHPSLPCYMYGGHIRNADFIGRDAILDEIDKVLLPKKSTGRTFGSIELQDFALCGLGGLGKTQIALHYAFTRQRHFDAIFWIQADSKTGLDNSFAQAAAKLGLAFPLELGDLAVSFSRMMEWLKNPTKRPSDADSSESPQMADSASWLLVYDNVIDFDLLAEYWPKGASGSILITSRHAEGLRRLDHGRNLKPMEGGEPMQLLLHMLAEHSQPYQSDDVDVQALLKKASGVPLAIVRFASLINTGTISIDELLGQWERHIRQSHFVEPQLKPDDIRYQHSLFTVWEFERLLPTTHCLLNVMSLLHPFHIQETILKQFGAAQSTAAYPKDEDVFISSRKELMDVYLTTRDPRSKSLELHPLVQDIVHDHLNPDQFAPYFSIAVRLLNASWPQETQKWSHEREHLKKAAQLIDHAQSLLGIYEKYESLKKLEAGVVPVWADLLMKSGWYLYQRSEYESAQRIVLLARKLADENDNKEILADALMTLIVIGLHTSADDALLALAKQHLSLRRAIFESEHAQPRPQIQYDLATGLSALASVYNNAGRFEEGLQTAQEALEVYNVSEEYQSGEKLALTPVQHQCLALWSLRRHEEARGLLTACLERTQSREDGRKFRYWRAGLYMILGNVQASLGDHSSSEDSYSQALSMFHRYNGDGVRTAIAHQKLADHAARRGDEVQAWTDYSIAMKLFEQNKYYGPELARVRIKAARFLRDYNRDPQEAQDLLRRASSTFRSLNIKVNVDTIDEESLTALVKLRSR